MEAPRKTATAPPLAGIFLPAVLLVAQTAATAQVPEGNAAGMPCAPNLTLSIAASRSTVVSLSCTEETGAAPPANLAVGETLKTTIEFDGRVRAIITTTKTAARDQASSRAEVTRIVESAPPPTDARVIGARKAPKLFVPPVPPMAPPPIVPEPDTPPLISVPPPALPFDPTSFATFLSLPPPPPAAR